MHWQIISSCCTFPIKNNLYKFVTSMFFLVPITTTHSTQTYYSLLIFTGSPNQQIKITVNISAYVYGSSVIMAPYDWLIKFYSFYMITIVNINIGYGLIIEVHHRNQPCKSNLLLYKPLICFSSHLKQTYISNNMERFGILLRWVWCTWVS